MSKIIKLKKGFDIKLKGAAIQTLVEDIHPDTFAVKPTDFAGMQRSKVVVNEGDNVKAGTPVLFDKKQERVMYAAPVSGEIVEIKRGEKRKLLEVKILADKQIEYESFKKYSVSDLQNANRTTLVSELLEGGIWPNIVQRPYGIVADPEKKPRAIFISGFDTHPLAPDFGFAFKGEEQYFQAGVSALKRMSEGASIHLNFNATGEVPTVFSQIVDVEVTKFSGPHPAGNVGVQIHHISPVNKGDMIWTLNPWGVIQIGKFFLEGRHDASRVIALTGSEVKSPQYYKTYAGACVDKFISGNLVGTHSRVISGNVLTGERIAPDGYLGYYHHQFTVIPEGDYYEMFGWILPTTKKLSFHRGFGLLSFLKSNGEFDVDTNLHGEPRAFVQTGTFEKVTPMDILPTYLLKAILAEDYDDMEALGIYEVVEEDLALCEFVDVSKHDVQSIVREGIDLMIHS